MLTNLVTQLLGAAARLDAIEDDMSDFDAAMATFDGVLAAIAKSLDRGPGVYICADGSVKIVGA
jgi:hypothetical protein